MTGFHTQKMNTSQNKYLDLRHLFIPLNSPSFIKQHGNKGVFTHEMSVAIATMNLESEITVISNHLQYLLANK